MQSGYYTVSICGAAEIHLDYKGGGRASNVSRKQIMRPNESDGSNKKDTGLTTRKPKTRRTIDGKAICQKVLSERV